MFGSIISRCTGSESSSEVDHTTCSCGEHCGCNPCACPKNVAAGTGCKCSSACACTSCHTWNLAEFITREIHYAILLVYICYSTNNSF